MDSTFLTAMAGVLGSLVGGTSTVAATWVIQRTLSKRESLEAEMRKREALYGQFISECSKRVVDSFERQLEKPETLLSIYELLNRIRLCSSDSVLREAERTLVTITEQYFGPNFSLEQVREIIRGGRAVDPLREFAEACRAELKSVRRLL
jgi:hypothetical protein